MSKPTYDELREALDKMQNLFTPDATKDCILDARALLARFRECVECEYGKPAGDSMWCDWGERNGDLPFWCSGPRAVSNDDAQVCNRYSAVDKRPTAPDGWEFKRDGDAGAIAVSLNRVLLCTVYKYGNDVKSNVLYRLADAILLGAGE